MVLKKARISAAISAASVSTSEMPCIVEDHLRARIISTEGVRAGREKEGVVLSPYRQRRRLMRAEEFLKLRIKRYVAFVVTDQIELNLGALRALQQSLVESDCLRRNAFLGIGHAVVVLPAGGFQAGKGAQGITVLLRRIFPVSTDRSPVSAETFDIGVPVLRDQPRDPLGIAKRQPEPNRSTVIEDVDHEPFQTDLFDEVSNDLGQMVEGVLKGLMIRRIGKSKAGKIRGNNVIIARQ